MPVDDSKLSPNPSRFAATRGQVAAVALREGCTGGAESRGSHGALNAKFGAESGRQHNWPIARPEDRKPGRPQEQPLACTVPGCMDITESRVCAGGIISAGKGTVIQASRFRGVEAYGRLRVDASGCFRWFDCFRLPAR
jgi:hypothetical protein